MTGQHKPRIRGPFCGGLYTCKGYGVVTSGLTPELAYRAWRAWFEGAVYAAIRSEGL